MDLDKSRIKILASDTRVQILKSLGQRRKMPSELAKELNIASSTVIEHLKQMEKSSFVKKKKSGKKWVYYELTEDGSDLIKPKFQVNILLGLGLGFVLLAGAYANYFTTAFPSIEIRQAATDFVSKIASPASAESVYNQLVQPEINFVAIFLALLGAAFISYSLLKYTKNWDFWS